MIVFVLRRDHAEHGGTTVVGARTTQAAAQQLATEHFNDLYATCDAAPVAWNVYGDFGRDRRDNEYTVLQLCTD